MKKIVKARRISSTSLMLTIPADVVKALNIKKDDNVEVVFLRTLDKEVKYKTFRCRKCGHIRDVREDEEIYCTACDCTDLEEIENSPDYICSICGKQCFGYGNNPEPLATGKCCDECNKTVIAQRITNLQAVEHSQTNDNNLN